MEQQLPAFGNKSDSDNLKFRISVPQMKSEKKTDRKERCHSSAMGIHALTYAHLSAHESKHVHGVKQAASAVKSLSDSTNWSHALQTVQISFCLFYFKGTYDMNQ